VLEILDRTILQSFTFSEVGCLTVDDNEP